MSPAAHDEIVQRLHGVLFVADAAESHLLLMRGCAADQRDVEQLLRVLREAAAGTLAALAAKGRKG